MLLFQKRGKLLFKQRFEVPFKYSEVPKLLNQQNKRKHQLDIGKGRFEIGNPIFPILQTFSQVFEFCCDYLGRISDMTGSNPALLNNRHEILVLQPVIFKPKKILRGDVSGKGDYTRDMI